MSDLKTKIVGVDEIYKPQAISEAVDFAIVLSGQIFYTRSSVVCDLLLFISSCVHLL